MRFIGTATDKLFIDSIPDDLDLKEKVRIYQDVRYVDDHDEYLTIYRVHEVQKNRVYLDEY